jgi:tetratricopeptide (TPR) repeat protein
MRRTLAVCVLAMSAIATNAFAVGEARITGKVIDAATKQPIPNAKVTVDSLGGKTVHQVAEVKKDGSYAIFLLDGTLKYKFTYSAPGYQDFIDQSKLKLGEPNVRDIELTAAGAAAQATVPASEIKTDPAVAAYNEGAQLANNGDDAGAIKKFQEAVAAKPDLIAGWEALAKVQARMKDYKGAIESAKKALAIADDETEMYQVLYDAYTATGDKASAAAAKAKLPANAGGTFNEAVPLLNAGKYAEAEPILLKVIQIDPSFADAYYHLGVGAMMKGDTAKSKSYFKKYLELAPNGQYADVAKEGLK